MAALPVRALQLNNRVLGESVRTTYFADGIYNPQALLEIRRLMRDKHDDTEIDIDPALLDLLWTVQGQLAPRTPIEVVCGYRSPETNARLRRTTRGVAANSFHMYGRAIDLRIPDVPLGLLRRTALDLEGGGVGYYPRSNFLHMDTGPVRTWNQGIDELGVSRRGLKRSRRTVRASTSRATKNSAVKTQAAKTQAAKTRTAKAGAAKGRTLKAANTKAAPARAAKPVKASFTAKRKPVFSKS